VRNADQTEQFDAVFLDPRSWGLEQPQVVLVTTDEGDRAIANGVFAEAYAKFLKKNEEYRKPSS
jgi:hypothetical protein